MKNLYKLICIITLLACETAFCGCSKDNNETQNIPALISDLQKYKWVYQNFDYINGEDWFLSDQETYTIYFVNNRECIVYYHCKHLDTDDGYSYTNNSETIKWNIDGGKIYFEGAHYISGNSLNYTKEGLVNGSSLYVKQELTPNDYEWIKANYKSTEFQNFNTIIKNHVKVTYNYKDYRYNIEIKSTLSKQYPNTTFKYGIVYGWGTSNYQQYVGTNGDLYRINTFSCESTSYLNSYEALNKKIENGEKLKSDEEDLLKELTKILKEDEKKYWAEIFVEVEGNKYSIWML